MDIILNVPYTLDQIRAATKAQIITVISNYLTNNLTKRQILVWLFNNVTIVPLAPARAYNPDGQVASDLDIDTDIETGVQTGGTQTTWTYYPTGEVDTITIMKLDAANNIVSTKVIKHFTDGRQPEVS